MYLIVETKDDKLTLNEGNYQVGETIEIPDDVIIQELYNELPKPTLWQRITWWWRNK